MRIDIEPSTHAPRARATSARLHLLVGVLVCVVIPAASRLVGDGALAWRMYTHSAVFRLRIIARQVDGGAHWIAPAALASRATPRAAWLFGGAESWHHGDGRRAFGRRLDELGGLACDVDPRAASVDVRLEQRDEPSAAIASEQRSVVCRH